jgi:hypothetical protein
MQCGAFLQLVVADMDCKCVECFMCDVKLAGIPASQYGVQYMCTHDLACSITVAKIPENACMSRVVR